MHTAEPASVQQTPTAESQAKLALLLKAIYIHRTDSCEGGACTLAQLARRASARDIPAGISKFYGGV